MNRFRCKTTSNISDQYSWTGKFCFRLKCKIFALLFFFTLFNFLKYQYCLSVPICYKTENRAHGLLCCSHTNVGFIYTRKQRHFHSALHSTQAVKFNVNRVMEKTRSQN